jgi:WD40 repeat protein
MSRVVRASKYRHVFGTAAKVEECYQNVNATRSAWDSNYIRANPKYLAVCWEAGGGGSLAVIANENSGKLAQGNVPLFAGHKGAVLDLDFNPFNDNLIASVSEDATIMIWGIPEGGPTKTVTEPLQTLQGHKRKVGTANFNPIANNVLATSSTDFTVKLWDIEQGKNIRTTEGHADIIQSLDWNYNGSQIATTCKDKKARIFDPRDEKISQEVIAHQGVKGSRVCWMKDKLLTVGFSKTSEREYNIYDPRNFTDPIAHLSIDSSAGIIMPFFDNDTNILFLAGKGDGNIRYYEIVDEAPYIHYLSEFKSATPQRGLAFYPKRGLNVSECEIARALKLTPNKIEPISFRVPRKSELFHDDLFPDTFSGEPSLTADEWLSGKNAEPKTMSLAPGHVVKERPAQEFVPVAQKVEGPQNEKELREEYEKLKQRVAYLESEIVKRDARIKDLENK